MRQKDKHVCKSRADKKGAMAGCRAPKQIYCVEGKITKQSVRRTKGGLNTKIHAVVDGLGNPLSSENAFDVFR